MTDARLIASGIGIGIAALGVVFVLVPGLASDLTTSRIVVMLIGVVAIGAIPIANRLTTETGGVATPTPESRAGAYAPGGTFDRKLADRAPEIRERLEATAVEVLSKLGECSAGEAREQLAEGTWTDDEAAAAFFSDNVHPGGGWRLPILGGEPVVVRQVHAVVSALAKKSESGTASTSVGPVLEGQEVNDVADASGGVDSRSENSIETESAPEQIAASLGETTIDRRTGRWRGVGALALLAIAIGVFTTRPPLILVGTVGVALAAFAAYGRAGRTDHLDLTIERVVETESPERGEAVSVGVTVRNESGRLLPDLRLLDGVPPGLVVVDGSPRHATALRPDEATTFTYTIRAEYGAHEFQPPVVVARDITGERERATRIGNSEPALTCRPPPETAGGLSLRNSPSGYVGQTASEEGGSGIEFHATREYRPSDPLSLIDWNRFARSGQLATMEFREERMAEVVLVVDARPTAHLAPTPEARSAVDRSVEAADVLTNTLLDATHRVGIAVISPNSEQCWLPPGSGTEHRMRARELLATHPALTPTSTGETFVESIQFRRLRRRLSADAQVVFLSPLSDDTTVQFVRRLEAGGTPTTVVTPDPTADRTTGQRLAGLERRTRVATLRGYRIPVYEWGTDESLELALSRDQREVRP